MISDARTKSTKNECKYRYYMLNGNQQRIGVGDFTCNNNDIQHHDDVDTLDYSLSLIVCGKLWFKDDSGNVRILKAGDVFQRVPGIIHSTCVVPTEEYREQFCLVSGELYHHLKAMYLIPDEITFNIEITPDLLNKFLQVKQIISSQSRSWFQNTLLMMQCWILAIEQTRNDIAMSDACSLEMLAKEQLLKSWNTPLPHVAEKLNMSYSGFRKWFKDTVGITPGSFRKVSRIQQSCELLEQHHFSITQVAEVLEYPDIYCFSRQFKQVMGMTPSKYQESHRKGAELPQVE